jgi:amino acid adenylation domain-containing protein
MTAQPVARNRIESREPDGGAGVHDLVYRQVIARPDACAVRDFRGAALTYAQLWKRSGQVAAVLARYGVGPGDRVAVGVDRTAELVCALLGILRAGAAYVPLDSHAPARRWSAILEQSGAGVLLHSGQDAGAGWPARVRPVTMPVAATAPAGAPPSRPVASGDTAFIGFTSGSTGAPKGVELSHRAIGAFVTRARYCAIEPDDRVAQLANPAFDMLTFEVWSTLAAGATVVVLPAVTEVAFADWVAAITDHRITVLALTTALADLVHRTAPGSFGSLRVLLFGGETADPEMVRGLVAIRPPQRVLHIYGPTEATTFATYYECTAANVEGLTRIPIGFPLQDTNLHIVDDQLRPLPDGERGELCIGGPRIATGYVNAPDLTSGKFVVLPGGERVYRTGDSVSRRADGALEFLGRIDRQVKLRGFRVELAEVERAVLATHLVDAVAVEKTGTGMRARLVGFVVPRAADRVSSVVDELSAALRADLPGYLIPHQWHVLPRMPLTQNGKVDRARLVDMLPGAVRPATREPAVDSGIDS